MTQEDQDAILAATTWNAADMGYFRGGGFSSRFCTEVEMPVTMIRLNLVQGLCPVLQIAEGWTVKLPEQVTDILWKRTDYTWPCTWFAPRTTGTVSYTHLDVYKRQPLDSKKDKNCSRRSLREVHFIAAHTSLIIHL